MTTMLRIAFVVALALAPSVRDAMAQPRPSYPALAVTSASITYVAVSISGTNFGTVGLLTVESDATTVIVPSDPKCGGAVVPPCVLFWEDTWITVRLATSMTRARVRVETAAGQSEFIRAQYYAHDYFAASPPTGGANPHPLALAIDPADSLHRVWVNEEFHGTFKYLTPSSGQITLLSHPVPSPPPFASVVDGSPTGAASGEDLLVDPYRRSWFDEAGYPTDGPNPSHQRIVVYDSAGTLLRAYNLPRNNDGVLGMAYERDYQPGKDRLWYTVQAEKVNGNVTIQPARLGWFQVEGAGAATYNNGTAPYTPTAACQGTCNDQTFTGFTCGSPTDCTPRCLSGQCRFGVPGTCTTDADCTPHCVKPPGATLGTCNAGVGGFCAGDSQCTAACVGTCADSPTTACSKTGDCWGDLIACAGTDTSPSCQYHEFELPGVYIPAHVALGVDGEVWVTGYWAQSNLLRVDKATGTVTSYPLGDDPARGVNWFLGSAPWELFVASNGDPIVNEYTDLSLNRFDHTRRNDTACLSLVSGKNPCIQTVDVPGPTVPNAQHTIFPDPSENVWLNTEGDKTTSASRATMGYVRRDWKAAVLFPPLTLDDFNTAGSDCPNLLPATYRAFTGAGLVVDPDNRDVWSADYCRKRLVRLKPKSRNLALTGPGVTASMWGGPLCFNGVCGDAANAIDGNIDGDWSHGSVAHTFNTSQPWWQVDLGASYPLQEVELWNRTDCCGYRLQNFDVFVSDDAFTSNDPAVLASTPEILRLHQDSAVVNRWSGTVNRTGRYVRVQLLGNGEPLQLAEVVVIGGRCTDNASCNDTIACTSDVCNTTPGTCSHSCLVNNVCNTPTQTCGGLCKNDTGRCMCVAQ